MPARSDEDIARTRAFWVSGKPNETAAPAYVPDPPIWWHVALALVVAIVFQTSFAPFVAIRGAGISFVAILVAWYAVRTGSLHGLLFGLIAGSAEDALAGSTGVAWTFATGFVGLAAGRIARTWLADANVALVPGIAALTLARWAAFAFVMQVQGRPLAMPETHLHQALWQSAFDAVATFVVLRFKPDIARLHAHRR